MTLTQLASPSSPNRECKFFITSLQPHCSNDRQIGSTDPHTSHRQEDDTIPQEDSCIGTEEIESYGSWADHPLPHLIPHSHNARGLIKRARLVDTGGYGSLSIIYRGYLQIEGMKAIDKRKLVAVKALRVTRATQADIERKITREARLWSCLYHENVLPFLGLYKSSSDSSELQLYLVSEWAPFGNAVQYLERRRYHAPLLVEGFISGLVYLHGGVTMHDPNTDASRLVYLRHLDLKPDNILVGTGPKALICDMGQAAEALAGGIAATHTGCPNYLSPELALASCSENGVESRRKLYEKADVYAFGLTCYSLMTGEIPFSGVSLAQMFVMLCKVHEDPQAFFERTPKEHPSLSTNLFNLLSTCWSIDPTERSMMIEFQAAYSKLSLDDRNVYGL